MEIKNLEKKILNGGPLSREETLLLSGIKGPDIFTLFDSSNRIREHFRGNKIGLCSIVNAKSGACSEDCSFCAQSSRSKAQIKVYPLMDKKIILQKAIEAKKSGIQRFSLVTSGRKVSAADLRKI
ncbi:MAG: biotin synthase BioB, partial [Nitrospirota bacterium]